jgi:pimeloyl-ACP methyl ester carboxylesterase
MSMNGEYEGGSGSPMVLLHGLGGSWRAWLPVIPLLEYHHKLYAPALPGHLGGISWPEDRHVSMESMVDLLAEVLEQKGIRKPHFVGNSLGGWLALEFVRRGLASSAVCFSPAGSWKSIDDFRSVARRFRRAYAIAPAMAPVVKPLLGFAGFRRLINRDAMERGDRVPPGEVSYALKAFCSSQILPRLISSIEEKGAIRPFDVGDTPTVIAWGEFDRVIPFEKHCAPMLSAIRGATYRELRGCGHVPMYDDPGRLASIILAATSDAEQRAVAAPKFNQR